MSSPMAMRFEIVYADGQRSRAELVGADVDSDLAVIKAEYIPEEMNPVELGIHGGTTSRSNGSRHWQPL
ncbi:MAG: hypothetical protein M5U34_11560 [Chloroflexi bacterium]|nr:hypothetical protein [Chloroflexota bacterium]